MTIESAAEFIRLRSSPEPGEYLRAATDAASDDVWSEVIERFPEERVWVAQNKTVPISILELLAADGDPRVRYMVAMKRKLPAELLNRLAIDADDSVRMAVARHRNTTRETLSILASDGWKEIREVVASRLRD